MWLNTKIEHFTCFLFGFIYNRVYLNSQGIPALLFRGMPSEAIPGFGLIILSVEKVDGSAKDNGAEEEGRPQGHPAGNLFPLDYQAGDIAQLSGFWKDIIEHFDEHPGGLMGKKAKNPRLLE